MRPKFVSLFAGCGGLDLGFIQEGFECSLAIDSDSNVLDVHSLNLQVPTYRGDLSDNGIDLSRYKGIDVLLSGPPCQGFSTAGKHNPADPRNELLQVTAEVASLLDPKVIIVENVTGVVSPRQKPHWLRLKETLLATGYRVNDFICKSENHGVAQIRHRMVMCAWKTSFHGEVAIKSSDPVPLSAALHKMGGLSDHSPKVIAPDSKEKQIARKIGQGQKLCNVRGGPRSVHTWDIPEVYGPTTAAERAVLEAILSLRRRIRLRPIGDADPVSARDIFLCLRKPVIPVLGSLLKKGYVKNKAKRFDLVNTFNGKFRRLCWDKPSFTVDTRFGEPRYFLHPDEDRGFSVREAARIQGFPDWFVLCGSTSQKHRMIGNAVPPPVSRLVANLVLSILS